MSGPMRIGPRHRPGVIAPFRLLEQTRGFVLPRRHYAESGGLLSIKEVALKIMVPVQFVLDLQIAKEDAPYADLDDMECCCIDLASEVVRALRDELSLRVLEFDQKLPSYPASRLLSVSCHSSHGFPLPQLEYGAWFNEKPKRFRGKEWELAPKHVPFSPSGTRAKLIQVTKKAQSDS